MLRSERAAGVRLMSTYLPDGMNQRVAGSQVEIDLLDVPTDESVDGRPVQGSVELGSVGSAEVGVWELRGGTVTDTEIDELFVVISGSAIIEFVEEDRTIEVTPGDIVRLVAGTRTRWTVQDHIRKVYIAEA